MQEGNFVLFYPEQSMWWNYRKPKPLKKGAYTFAVNNQVPVLPCFITMQDSNLLDQDGFPIQEYTIHISKPIYPDASLKHSENVESMRRANYEVWKEIYEKTYGIPLESMPSCRRVMSRNTLKKQNKIHTIRLNYG